MPTIWFFSWRWTAVNSDLWPQASTSVYLALFPQPEVKSPCTLSCGVCDSDAPPSTFQPSTYTNVRLQLKPAPQMLFQHLVSLLSLMREPLICKAFFFSLEAILNIYFIFCSRLPGVLGAGVQGFNLPCEDQPITCRMAIICGTSTCHMAVSVALCFCSFQTRKKVEPYDFFTNSISFILCLDIVRLHCLLSWELFQMKRIKAIDDGHF